ncbi:Fmp45p [Saccharomyces paradoxus]|uniref:Fmp45p n=1 Tax=Saccharomyces paradoxus TaxID=27291 RepID=A0A8B8UMQ9_SACPA|nr:Fmp45 [Saccharomyces paradoxus]QHS72026.1 Fmp45 [Saccharomyces paradoxus]
MIFKRFVNLLVFLFLLGAGLLTFFLILSGGRESGTLKNFYWLQADTDGFNSAPSTTRWYNYNWCGYEDGQLANCSSRAPAKPFSPRDNFGNSANLPSSFRNNRDAYYYLSRVGWAMLLIALFFIVMALVPGFLATFLPFKAVPVLYCVLSWLAFFFIILAACLYTGCYVKARKTFHNSGRSARLGPKNFAFIWTSVFLMLVNAIWSTIFSATHKGHSTYSDHDMYAQYESPSVDTGAQMEKSTYNSGVTDGAGPVTAAPVVGQPQPTTTTTQAGNGKFFQKLKTRKQVPSTELEPAGDGGLAGPVTVRD